MDQLSDYIFKSDLITAKSLLDAGADINSKYGSGVYPIDAAINSDNPKNLKFVINHGADVNIEYGLPLSTALDYSMDGLIQDDRRKPYPETLEMITILIDHGADLSIKDLNGNRPIDILKAYAPKPKKLRELKEIFRPVINNIDELLK